MYKILKDKNSEVTEANEKLEDALVEVKESQEKMIEDSSRLMQLNSKLIDSLRKIDANIRFLSIEPLLEEIYNLKLDGIDWVIVGGESGPKARQMNKEWVFKIKEQCDDENIPFFFKQWGTWGADGKKRSKKANGIELNGKVYQQVPVIK